MSACLILAMAGTSQTVRITYQEQSTLPEAIQQATLQSKGIAKGTEIIQNLANTVIIHTLDYNIDSSSYIMRRRLHLFSGDTSSSRSIFLQQSCSAGSLYLSVKNDSQSAYTREVETGYNWRVDIKLVRDIMGYKCYAATTQFKAQQIRAWFAPSLPTRFGPKGLNGLKGAILLVETLEHDWQIVATNIDKRTAPVKASWPPMALCLDPAEWKKYRNSEFDRLKF